MMARPAPWCDTKVRRVQVGVSDTYGVALVEFASSVKLGTARTCAGPCAAPRRASAGSRARLEHIAQRPRLVLHKRDCARGVEEEMVCDFREHRRDYKVLW